MDVISLISKPAGLPDAPKSDNSQYGNPETMVANGPRVHEFLQEMHQAVMDHHQMVTVGETPGVTTKEAQKYANLNNRELNMVFQFEHMSLDGNPNPQLGKWYDQKVKLSLLRENLSKWQTELAGQAWNSLYWNNHDQPRAVSRFGDDSTETYREKSAKMLATILHFQQGTPYIYEGEEIGMTNYPFQDLSDYNDLESINAYHQLVDQAHLLDGKTMLKYLAFHSRDNARTPMQWDDTTHAGFTTGQPWLPVNPNYSQLNVQQALADPNSIFYYYQRLIQLRHELPVITNGQYALIAGNLEDPDVYAYTRDDGQQKLWIIANFTKQTLQRDFSIPKAATRLISNYDDDQLITLRPYEAKVYQQIY